MQLPLPVTLPTDETFTSFAKGTNEELVGLLQAIADASPAWQEAQALRSLVVSRLPLVTMVGSEGRGKSHLLYALCHQLAAKQAQHIYLNLEESKQWTRHAFDGLENLPLVCLDNIHCLAGSHEWEEALFDLINRIVETRRAILVCTSEFGPSHPAFVLPDLRSRLAWGTTYQVQGLNDEERKSVVRNRAEQRGLKLSEQALQFLLHHCERDLPSLMALLERLDKRSLQEQKKLSVALVKRELELD
ncbi:DnaA regulatory inactivator Hda [Alteromonas pelagimontana]|uniref:DnaA regulatory inactivator Hda n=1 Tax=Alteromonas pelagimontana TaxID=1858656 RepID=A0A6M4M8S0_9ALTE|nr:DnaA regulatory inactivator Hda [Alteromonas pelagimontana]QJR79379.1 DnaA regulatory inactivator Hda [Alteromonas pelagimontana]